MIHRRKLQNTFVRGAEDVWTKLLTTTLSKLAEVAYSETNGRRKTRKGRQAKNKALGHTYELALSVSRVEEEEQEAVGLKAMMRGEAKNPHCQCPWDPWFSQLDQVGLRSLRCKDANQALITPRKRMKWRTEASRGMWWDNSSCALQKTRIKKHMQ